MNAPQTMHAAADALRGGTPRDEATAAWLEDTAVELEAHMQAWDETGQDDETVRRNIQVLYALPLAVAQAVLAEVAVP